MKVKYEIVYEGHQLSMENGKCYNWLAKVYWGETCMAIGCFETAQKTLDFCNKYVRV